MSAEQSKIIVIDDDPTGSQTVHSCPLLLRWDVETLRAGLADPSPLCFILSNTRAMMPEQAAQVMREIAGNLRVVLQETAASAKAPPILVSRSDSTLRGHYPFETDVLVELLGPFDAHFLVPAFFEGGRSTRNGIHYVRQNGVDVPAHETEFARDSVFAFHHSYLPDYVAEKTRGRIPAAAVQRISLGELREGGCLPRLLALQNNACVVVDAETPADLAAFARDVQQAVAQGKRFLFRSAASLLTALADLPPQPVAAAEMRRWVRNARPGLILVGSHVRKTTEQLDCLLQGPDLEGVEVDVDRCQGAAAEAQLADIVRRAAAIHARGNDIVLYTSRSERQFADQPTRLAFGAAVSAFLMHALQVMPKSLGYLISKGGITSNDVLSQGLALRQARVLGQILPGCSMLQCPEDHAQFPALPVVIFPGNVGDAAALALARRRLRRTE